MYKKGVFNIYFDYVHPEFRELAFNCIYCKAYSSMIWNRLHDPSEFNHNNTRIYFGKELHSCRCFKCNKISYWIKDDYDSFLIFPLENTSAVDPPHMDMPEDVALDYNEAASIVSHSKRGACALLRLAIEKLCKQLGSQNKNLNDNIAYLVSQKNLDLRVQQSLDLLRVIGNSAVHPGLIDVNDMDKEIVYELFKILNNIVETQISQPKINDNLYNTILNEETRDSIKKRDSK